MVLENSNALNKIAVVTGAAGFIGRAVCKKMAAAGWTVYGIGHGDWPPFEFQQFGVTKWLNADVSLENLQLLVGDQYPLSIVHCAGGGAVSAFYIDPYKDFERTVTSTAIVLEFARLSKVGGVRVVVASSAAVYGDQGDVDFFESSPRMPISPYGFHKMASENICESYSKYFGLSVSVVRLFSVYGDGLRKQLLWDALNKFSAGRCDFFGTGSELRDWIHVDDAADFLCKAATLQQESFAVYNGGNVHATTNEVLTMLAQMKNSSLFPKFNNEVHTGNPKRLTSNCSTAHEKLDWYPTVNLQDGLSRYVGWHNSEGKK